MFRKINKGAGNYYPDYTAQKMKFSFKDFFSKCDKIPIYWGFGHIY